MNLDRAFLSPNSNTVSIRDRAQKSLILLVCSLVCILAVAAQAGEPTVTYQINAQIPVANMVRFSIPYTFGTHEGNAHTISGTLQTDAKDVVLKAQFKVPIQYMTTGNRTRDCHMREALGIDYTNSVFPKEHVCNSNDEIPTSGPDSVVHPEIIATFVDMALPQENALIIGTPLSTVARVKLQVHGVEKLREVPIVVTKTIDNGVEGFRITSKHKLSLRDYQVQVKPFKMGFKVEVRDEVTLNLDLQIVRVQ